MRTPCSSTPTIEESRSGSYRVALVVLALAVLAAAGCSDRQKRHWRYRSAERNFRTALEAEHPDERRDAVARIGESWYADREDAFHVLDAVARTDPVIQIRCIAIRAFAGYDDARPVGTLLTVLQAKNPTDQTLPPDDDLRWETVTALAALTRKGVMSETQRDLVCPILIKLLETDPSRNVRIVAAKALAEFKDRQVLLPLIRSLRNEDFGIADRAERSLIALTGVTHYYDADAWEAWVARAEDPFAHAGEIPQTTRPAGPTWWDKQKRAWRRALKLSNE